VFFVCALGVVRDSGSATWSGKAQMRFLVLKFAGVWVVEVPHWKARGTCAVSFEVEFAHFSLEVGTVRFQPCWVAVLWCSWCSSFGYFELFDSAHGGRG